MQWHASAIGKIHQVFRFCVDLEKVKFEREGKLTFFLLETLMKNIIKSVPSLVAISWYSLIIGDFIQLVKIHFSKLP